MAKLSSCTDVILDHGLSTSKMQQHPFIRIYDSLPQTLVGFVFPVNNIFFCYFNISYRSIHTVTSLKQFTVDTHIKNVFFQPRFKML